MTLMSEPVTSLQDDTRKQLGAFLRARRESLDPQRLGLPRSGRRRTPGLRREEVAMLADVGVTGTLAGAGPGRQSVQRGDGRHRKSAAMHPDRSPASFVLAGLPPGEAPQAVCCEDQRRHASPAGYPDAETCQYSETEFRYRGVERQLRPPDGRRFQRHPAGRSQLYLPVPHPSGVARAARQT